MKDLKGIKFLVLLLIVFVFLAGIYYTSFLKQQGSSSNKSPESTLNTADWKTYSSTKYGFSFKYPLNLFIRQDSRDEFIGLLKSPNENNSQKVVVGVRSNPQNIEIQELAEKNKPIPDDTQNVRYERTQINGYEALITRYELPCLGLCPNEKIYKYFSIGIQGKGFIVTFSGDESGPEAEALVNQIVATFSIF